VTRKVCTLQHPGAGARIARGVEQGQLVRAGRLVADDLDEVADDVAVAATAQAVGPLGGRRRPPLGGEVEQQGVREAGAQPLHRSTGAKRVGEGHLQPVVLVAGVCGAGEQLLEGAADARQAARDRRCHEVDPLDAVLAELDEPTALGVVCLGERVRQR
jgi:hypothetical protein